MGLRKEIERMYGDTGYRHYNPPKARETISPYYLRPLEWKSIHEWRKRQKVRFAEEEFAKLAFQIDNIIPVVHQFTRPSEDEDIDNPDYYEQHYFI